MCKERQRPGGWEEDFGLPDPGAAHRILSQQEKDITIRHRIQAKLRCEEVTDEFLMHLGYHVIRNLQRYSRDDDEYEASMTSEQTIGFADRLLDNRSQLFFHVINIKAGAGNDQDDLDGDLVRYVGEMAESNNINILDDSRSLVAFLEWLQKDITKEERSEMLRSLFYTPKYQFNKQKFDEIEADLSFISVFDFVMELSVLFNSLQQPVGCFDESYFRALLER